MSESLTYIVIEGGSSKINCKALYGYEKNQTLIWTWYKDNYPVASIDNLNIQNDDARHESTIEIKNAIQQNEGYYKLGGKHNSRRKRKNKNNTKKTNNKKTRKNKKKN